MDTGWYLGGDVRAHYLLGKVKNRALMSGQKGGTL